MLSIARRDPAFLFFFLMIRRPPRSTLLSLHDALPILDVAGVGVPVEVGEQLPEWHGKYPHPPAPLPIAMERGSRTGCWEVDRKSTCLNSSHANISYAVFCLKKKKKHEHRLLYYSAEHY